MRSHRGPAAVCGDEGRREATVRARLPGWEGDDPRSIHDLIDCLLDLPIDVRRAQYLEGGPEAVLYVAGGNRTLEFLGTGSPTADESAGLGFSFPIPNVIGLERRRDGPESP